MSNGRGVTQAPRSGTTGQSGVFLLLCASTFPQRARLLFAPLAPWGASIISAPSRGLLAYHRLTTFYGFNTLSSTF